MTGQLKSHARWSLVVLPPRQNGEPSIALPVRGQLDRSWSNCHCQFLKVLFNKMRSHWVIITTQMKQHGDSSPGVYLHISDFRLGGHCI